MHGGIDLERGTPAKGQMTDKLNCRLYVAKLAIRQDPETLLAILKDPNISQKIKEYIALTILASTKKE